YCGESGCLRQYIRTYFGESAPARCDGCSSCSGHRYGEAAEARKPKARRRPLHDEPAADGMTRLKLPKPGEGSLFEQLRACRLQLSKQYRVPPYIVCDDKTLNDMARRRPVTMEGLLTVHGMGEVKAARYGEAFLRVIRDYDKTRTTLTLPRQGPAETPIAAGSVPPGAKRTPPSPSLPGSGKPAGPLTRADREQLRQDYLAGVSIARMAASLGRTEQEIRRTLQQMGLII
ncbi:MAG: HRDC domain-containing protein, partial [Aristaeellaceae bacterium]